ncbi:MAG: hypothetical protein Q8O84_01725 [Nanoarchaeota archaeon]|nr:hypothetical protein [Nanoarchaeota archaeon]
MDVQKIREQCLNWYEQLEIETRKLISDKRYLEKKREMENFTKNNLEKIANPKYELFSTVKQNCIKSYEDSIFFLRERQIFEKEGKLEWRYFGYLFDVTNNKINYRTAPGYIPEEQLASLN